jgi:hypothetical protein
MATEPESRCEHRLGTFVMGGGVYDVAIDHEPTPAECEAFCHAACRAQDERSTASFPAGWRVVRTGTATRRTDADTPHVRE